MDPGSNAHESTEEIDETYRDVDPDDVAENAIDFFRGDPQTESRKASGPEGDS